VVVETARAVINDIGNHQRTHPSVWL